MARAIVSVEIRGMKELRRAMRRDSLLEKPYRDFLDKAVKVAEAEVRDAAPEADSGRLNKSIKGKVTGGKVAKQGKVTVGAKRGGVAYPHLLNSSGRHNRRGGGGPTKGWFDGAAEKAQPKIDRLADDLGRDIEEAFKR